MSSKNVDAPKRPDTKSRPASAGAMKVKSGQNKHPKLSAKKSAHSTKPGSMRESGVRTGMGHFRTNPVHGMGKH